jgi:hypothetical protein
MSTIRKRTSQSLGFPCVIRCHRSPDRCLSSCISHGSRLHHKRRSGPYKNWCCDYRVAFHLRRIWRLFTGRGGEGYASGAQGMGNDGGTSERRASEVEAIDRNRRANGKGGSPASRARLAAYGERSARTKKWPGICRATLMNTALARVIHASAEMRLNPPSRRFPSRPWTIWSIPL